MKKSSCHRVSYGTLGKVKLIDDFENGQFFQFFHKHAYSTCILMLGNIWKKRSRVRLLPSDFPASSKLDSTRNPPLDDQIAFVRSKYLDQYFPYDLLKEVIEEEREIESSLRSYDPLLGNLACLFACNNNLFLSSAQGPSFCALHVFIIKKANVECVFKYNFKTPIIGIEQKDDLLVVRTHNFLSVFRVIEQSFHLVYELEVDNPIVSLSFNNNGVVFIDSKRRICTWDQERGFREFNSLACKSSSYLFTKLDIISLSDGHSFLLADNCGVDLFDIREGFLEQSKSIFTLPSPYFMEPNDKLRASCLYKNVLCCTSNSNLNFFDLRIPDIPLLQWSLPSASKHSFSHILSSSPHRDLDSLFLWSHAGSDVYRYDFNIVEDEIYSFGNPNLMDPSPIGGSNILGFSVCNFGPGIVSASLYNDGSMTIQKFSDSYDKESVSKPLKIMEKFNTPCKTANFVNFNPFHIVKIEKQFDQNEIRSLTEDPSELNQKLCDSFDVVQEYEFEAQKPLDKIEEFDAKIASVNKIAASQSSYSRLSQRLSQSLASRKIAHKRGF